MKHKIGTNQYRIKPKYRFWKTLFLSLLVISLISAIGFTSQVALKQVEARKNIISPLAIGAEIPSPKYTIPQIDTKHKDGVIALIKKVWGKHAKIGIALSQCESGFNPEATHLNSNNTIDEGVFQVNSVHGMPNMKDPVANISYSYTKFLEQGTSPWDSSKKCWGDKV